MPPGPTIGAFFSTISRLRKPTSPTSPTTRQGDGEDELDATTRSPLPKLDMFDFEVDGGSSSLSVDLTIVTSEEDDKEKIREKVEFDVQDSNTTTAFCTDACRELDAGKEKIHVRAISLPADTIQPKRAVSTRQPGSRWSSKAKEGLASLTRRMSLGNTRSTNVTSSSIEKSKSNDAIFSGPQKTSSTLVGNSTSASTLSEPKSYSMTSKTAEAILPLSPMKPRCSDEQEHMHKKKTRPVKQLFSEGLMRKSWSQVDIANIFRRGAASSGAAIDLAESNYASTNTSSDFSEVHASRRPAFSLGTSLDEDFSYELSSATFEKILRIEDNIQDQILLVEYIKTLYGNYTLRGKGIEKELRRRQLLPMTHQTYSRILVVAHDQLSKSSPEHSKQHGPMLDAFAERYRTQSANSICRTASFDSLATIDALEAYVAESPSPNNPRTGLLRFPRLNISHSVNSNLSAFSLSPDTRSSSRMRQRSRQTTDSLECTASDAKSNGKLNEADTCMATRPKKNNFRWPPGPRSIQHRRNNSDGVSVELLNMLGYEYVSAAGPHDPRFLESTFFSSFFPGPLLTDFEMSRVSIAFFKFFISNPSD